MRLGLRRLTAGERLFPVSLALLLLSLALLMKGTVQFFAPGAGQDFSYRWSAQHYGAAVAGYVAVHRAAGWLASGIAVALAEVETTIGGPLAVAVLVQRKLLARGVAGVILLLATTWSRLTLGLDYTGLFQSMLEGVG